jgi:ADP-L-glycero-D-manno-heptose 6-epimerase
MLVLVTGGAGFIGSRVVHALSSAAHDVIMVDSLGDGIKWRNLEGVTIWRWYQPSELTQALSHQPHVVIHMGATSSTTVTQGDQVLANNFDTSVCLWDWCSRHRVPFVYASSASTYGDGSLGFDDDPNQIEELRPLNLYGWSKQLFDRRVTHMVRNNQLCPPQWAGLKFFNVYGPGESHKGDQSSVIFKQWQRIQQGLPIQLFHSTDINILDGDQRRDFVWVDDCVDVITWAAMQSCTSGLFNVGSGVATTFNHVALTLLKATGSSLPINYVPMPDQLAVSLSKPHLC